MDTDTVSDMAVTTDMVDTLMLMVDTVTSARGPLMPNPRSLVLPSKQNASNLPFPNIFNT